MPEQSVSMQTDRAGVITHRENDLLIQLRAVSADELNQQFVTHSANGPESTNPYTFGDTRFWDGEQQRDRFTVYHLKVVNEGFPKVKIDPARVVMATDRGRQYWSLSLQQLDTYYRAYATGFRGNEYARYQERLDLLRRTMYKNEEVFDGQTIAGYLVFPSLHQESRYCGHRRFAGKSRGDDAEVNNSRQSSRGWWRLSQFCRCCRKRCSKCP
jgi:hypothetical protein